MTSFNGQGRSSTQENGMPSETVDLSSVFGFVTEFNANTQIFGLASLLLTAALLDLGIKTQVDVNTADIARLKGDLGGILALASLFRPPTADSEAVGEGVIERGGTPPIITGSGPS